MPDHIDVASPLFITLSGSHLREGMKWFERKCGVGEWNFNRHERLHLLGSLSEAEYDAALNVTPDTELSELSHKILERLSLLYGISNGLADLAGTGSPTALFFLPNANPIFNLSSIKDFLLSTESTEDFYKVKQYLLDAL
jgi:hypothetical protein